MKLLRLTLENFRGAPDGTYAFAHASTGRPLDLVFVTGGPASGKSSILEAVAAVKELVGGYGPPPDPARLRRSGASTGKIAATWHLTGEEAARAGVEGPAYVTEVSLADGPAPLFDPGPRALFSAFSTDPMAGKFELFPANRRLALAPAPARGPSTFAAARLRLARDPAKYAGLRGALVELAVRDAMVGADRLASRGVLTRWEQPDSFGPIKRSLAALAPWLRFVGVQQEGDLPRVRFQRNSGAELELEDLSEAEQQALLFSVTFDRLGLNRSIVLLDQPELFIHPDAQGAFFRTIAGLGADNQIIAATASAEILAAASPQEILRLGPRPR